jgi:hypothetical protein
MGFKNLLTVKQVAEASPAFTEASLRWLIFNAEKNGLVKAIVKVGRRVLIDETVFDDWLAARKCGPTGEAGHERSQ